MNWALFRKIAVTGWLVMAASVTAAQSTDALLKDLHQQKQTDSHLHSALWLPPEFFTATMAADGQSVAAAKKFQQMLDGYVLFLVADADIGAMGVPAPRGRAELISHTRLVIDGGTPLSSLPDADLRGDLKVLVSTLKPLFKGMLGSWGEALEPIVFKLPAKGGLGGSMAMRDGRIALVLGEGTFDWRTPLGSLMPPKFDPETNEQFPGNYLYSPFSGRKLTTR